MVGRRYVVESTDGFSGAASVWTVVMGPFPATLDVTRVLVPLPVDAFLLYRVRDVTGDTVTPPPVPEAVTVGAALEASGTAMRLSWPGSAGTRYRVQSTTNLTDWVDIEPQITGNGDPVSVTVDFEPGMGRFHRVVSLPSP